MDTSIQKQLVFRMKWSYLFEACILPMGNKVNFPSDVSSTSKLGQSSATDPCGFKTIGNFPGTPLFFFLLLITSVKKCEKTLHEMKNEEIITWVS